MRALAFVLLAVLFCGCGRPEPSRSHSQLTVVQTQDFPSLDPIFVSGVGGQELGALLYSYLVKIDDRGRLIPDAAVSVPTLRNGGISRNGLTVTYHLRPGLRFSDGSPLTASDVADTIRHVSLPGSDAPSRLAFDDIASVATPDPLTIRVVLRHPYAPIVLYLCGPANAVPILDAAQLRGHVRLRGTALDSRPIGSGPYVVRRWQRGARLELVANRYYAGPKPAISRLTILPVPSSNTAREMLRAGEADAYVNADDEQYPLLREIPGIRTEQVPIDGTGALIFNTSSRDLRDARVRRAIARAMDARTIVDKTLLGASRSRAPGRGLFQWAYDPRAYAMPRYDPQGARRLLRAAGWRVGPGGLRYRNGRALSLEIIARADKPSAVSMATQIALQERAVGVRVTIRRFDVTALVAPRGPLYGGHYDLAIFPFIAGFDPDVTDQFSCNRVPPRGFNKSRYCNRALDVLMRDAVRPYDRAARIPYYRKIERMLAADLPMVAMYQAVSINAFPSWLHGERSAPNTPFWNVADWR